MSCSGKQFNYTFNLTSFHQYKLKSLLLYDSTPMNGSMDTVDLVKVSFINCSITHFSRKIHLPNLVYLDLKHNKITQLSNIIKSKRELLQHLDLSWNPIRKLINHSLIPNLKIYDLSFTKIQSLNAEEFHILQKLMNLSLKGCLIQNIEKNFLFLNRLKYLNLKATKFPIQSSLCLIEHLKDIEVIENEYFTVCCFARKLHPSSLKSCSPSKSLFNTCSDLLASKLLKFMIWMFGIFGVLANGFSIIFRLFHFTRFSHMFSVFMSIGDTLTGVYLISIGSVDIYYRDIFYKYENYWVSSFTCKFLGSLMNFSLLLSTFNLFLMSFEKFYVITFTRYTVFANGFIIPLIVITLIFCCAIAVFPIIYYTVE